MIGIGFGSPPFPHGRVFEKSLSDSGKNPGRDMSRWASELFKHIVKGSVIQSGVDDQHPQLVSAICSKGLREGILNCRQIAREPGQSIVAPLRTPCMLSRPCCFAFCRQLLLRRAGLCFTAFDCLRMQRRTVIP